MNKLLLGAVAGTALLIAAPVFAADLNEPIPAAPYAPPASTAFDWTGAYVGVNGSYNWATQSEDAGTGNVDGMGLGAFAGYNFQMPNNIVVGAEGEVAYGGSDPLTTWTTAVRGRVGYAFDNLLVYGTAGGLIGKGEMKSAGASADRTHMGYQVGAGLEAALTQNITARAEYLYTDTNSKDYDLAGRPTGDLDGNSVRVGVAYKF